jgi:hypothetical protein
VGNSGSKKKGAPITMVTPIKNEIQRRKIMEAPDSAPPAENAGINAIRQQYHSWRMCS